MSIKDEIKELFKEQNEYIEILSVQVHSFSKKLK